MTTLKDIMEMPINKLTLKHPNMTFAELASNYLRMEDAIHEALAVVQDAHGVSNHDQSCVGCRAATILKRGLEQQPSRDSVPADPA